MFSHTATYHMRVCALWRFLSRSLFSAFLGLCSALPQKHTHAHIAGSRSMYFNEVVALSPGGRVGEQHQGMDISPTGIMSIYSPTLAAPSHVSHGTESLRSRCVPCSPHFTSRPSSLPSTSFDVVCCSVLQWLGRDTFLLADNFAYGNYCVFHYLCFESYLFFSQTWTILLRT